MSEFADVKPFPTERDERLDNLPPLEDRLSLALEDTLFRKGLNARVDEITSAATRAPDPIANDDDAGVIGDLLAQAKAAHKAIDSERDILNRPLLNAQRAMKSKADAITLPMDNATKPLAARLNDYMADADAPVHGDMGARVGTRTDHDFEIVDFAKLPLAIRRHPDVVAAMNKVIRSLIKGGARSIAGVKITEAKHVVIR